MEYGTVKKIIDDKRALVIVQPNVSCESCKSAGSCHQMDTKGKEVEVQYESAIAEGQLVEVLIEPGYRIISSMILFLTPVIFLIGGYFAGKHLFKNEDLAILSSVIALIVSFVFLFAFFQTGRKFRKDLPKAFPLSDNSEAVSLNSGC